MNKHTLRLVVVACLALSTACSPSLTPPAGFVEINGGALDYRATSADGLVIGVRQIKHQPKGDLAFWVRAIENEMRAGRGYALLETREVKTQQGLKGRQLRFGHDEGAEPHLYYVSVFITDGAFLASSYLYIVEAGGKKALVESNEQALQTAIASLDAR